MVLLASGVPIAQAPRIAVIDYYGLRTVPPARVGALLGVKEGDPLRFSKGAVEERLEDLPGVVRARVEAVCCEAGNAILYVGIEERGAPHFDFRTPPAESVTLPEEIVSAYRDFLKAFAEAARRGDSAEDLSPGHALGHNPEVRARQERFLNLAEVHAKLLQHALRHSADEQQRAIAACVLGYAPRKSDVVDDLQYAMQDPNDAVRSNSIRSLTAIAELAAREPDRGIRVAPTWFIEMLNSIIWSDRHRAAQALVSLTESRDRRVLEHLKERALPALAEMARWKTLAHALPAFILVGRLAGLPEEQIHAAWEKGEREAVVQQALAAK